jgi:uncharacterized protein (DUF1499 family)
MHYSRSFTAILIVAILMTNSTTAGIARRLADCPQTPNCVSSQATDKQHAIAPFSFSGAAQSDWGRLRVALLSQRRTRIVEEDASYLHAEVHSKVFGFIDDLEFVLVPEEGIIHVRSASRSGYSDFGVNRRRVERIRRAFNGQ